MGKTGKTSVDGVGHTTNILDQPKRDREHRPLDVRLGLYDEVLRLRKESHSYAEIKAEIEKRHHLSLSKATISNWIGGVCTPFNSGHMFTPKPSPELAYVIGVETGDASLNVKIKTYQYRIRLQAVDREFVEAFNQAMAKLLGCPPHHLWKGGTAKETHVEYGSYLLHKFLKQPFESLKPFIEHDKGCVAAFVKGFFDSEGCVDKKGGITASNSNLELLRYMQFLLTKHIGIETTGPHLGTRKGSLLTRRGKTFRRQVDCYFIYVRRAFLRRYYEEIGLTIPRKILRLEKALGIRQGD